MEALQRHHSDPDTEINASQFVFCSQIMSSRHKLVHKGQSGANNPQETEAENDGNCALSNLVV